MDNPELEELAHDLQHTAASSAAPSPAAQKRHRDDAEAGDEDDEDDGVLDSLASGLRAAVLGKSSSTTLNALSRADVSFGDALVDSALVDPRELLFTLLRSIFFPAHVPVLLLDAYRRRRVDDWLRSTLQRWRGVWSFVLMLPIYALTAFIYVSFYTSDKSAPEMDINHALHVTSPLVFLVVSMAVFSAFELIGRDDIDLYTSKRQAPVGSSSQREDVDLDERHRTSVDTVVSTVNDEVVHVQSSDKRWSALCGYKFKAKAFDPHQGIDKAWARRSLTGAYIEQCRRGQFTADVIVTQIMVTTKAEMATSTLLAPFPSLMVAIVAGVATAAMPTGLWSARDHSPDGRGVLISYAAALVLGILTVLHTWLLMHGVGVYRERRLRMVAVHALMQASSPGFPIDLPHLHMQSADTAIAWSKTRSFLQTVKRRRQTRFEAYYGLLMAPFILGALVLLIPALLGLDGATEDTEPSTTLFALLVFDAVLVGSIIIAVLLTAASTNEIETELHVPSLLRKRIRVSEHMLHLANYLADPATAELDAEDRADNLSREGVLERFRQLRIAHRLLGDIADLLRSAGGSCSFLGINVDYSLIFALAGLVISALAQYASTKAN